MTGSFDDAAGSIHSATGSAGNAASTGGVGSFGNAGSFGDTSSFGNAGVVGNAGSPANAAGATGTSASAANTAGSTGNTAAVGKGAPAGKVASAGKAGAFGKAGLFGKVSSGHFGNLAFGPPGNAAFGSAGKFGAAAFGAGKMAATGIGAKLFTVFLALLILPVGAVLFLGATMFSRKKEPARPAVRPYRRNLNRLIAQRFVAILLLVATAGLLGFAGSLIYDRVRTHNLTIAAGWSQAESFIFMQALKTVTAHYHPRIHITVLETSGSIESLQRLEKGDAQLAAAQADVPPGSNARTVAMLYNDTFQLLIHKNSPIAHVVDLKGKRIALPKSTAQYTSFLSLANHFGMKDGDFTFVGGDDEAANVAFARNEADALFKVRPLHNAEIKNLVSSGTSNLIAIDDTAALHVEAPADNPSTIPKGAYSGDPAIPLVDIATLSTERLLLANRNVDKYAIQELTQVLIERREEIAAAIPASHISMRPLAALISEPAVQAGLSAPMHPGALAFYNHDQGAFVTGNLDLIALGLVAFVLIALWVSELRRLGLQGLKHHSDLYNRQLVEILEEASLESADHAILRAKLNAMLIRAIRDLDEDKMSEESFRSFHIVWQTAMDTVRERPHMGGSHPASATQGTSSVPTAGTQKWSFSKLLQRAN